MLYAFPTSSRYEQLVLVRFYLISEGQSFSFKFISTTLVEITKSSRHESKTVVLAYCFGYEEINLSVVAIGTIIEITCARRERTLGWKALKNRSISQPA